MGRAAREKRRREEGTARVDGPPRWAGANGFDYAWTLNRGYLAVVETINYDGTDPLRVADANVAAAQAELDMLERKLGTMEAAARAHGLDLRRQLERTEPALPGRMQIDDEPQVRRTYAAGLGELARAHEDVLCQATPILFDPLSTPEIDDNAIDGLRLPFPVVTCDFLAQSGISMPVMAFAGEDHWVGVIAATIAEAGDGVFDVWPIVTTLRASRKDNEQRQKALLYGRARLGGRLGEPPEGLVEIDLSADGFGASAWVMPAQNPSREHDAWGALWVLKPALAAISALRLLDAVNVSLEEAQLDRPGRRRAQREGRKPSLEVAVRSSAHTDRAAATSTTVDWQHRWTVRGHWMHFKRGPVFNANPRKRIVDPVHGECVRVWCPPFVKGPAGRPLVLKSRRLTSTPERMAS